MNIALIGSGGREDALCRKLKNSQEISNIFCIPGNAGTAKIAINLDINFLNFKLLLKTLNYHNVELVIVGPEEPLVKGIVNFLEKNKIKVFGPNKFASQLEGSKAFMKLICKKYKIPTARFKICKNKNDFKNSINKFSLPIVVKADGLAAGKGVVICKTKNKAYEVSKQIFKGKFKSSKKLVLEEFLEGEEASYFLVVDKNGFIPFGTAQDHKKVYEKEKGPNTGGMGAYSPAPVINKNLEKKIIQRIVEPTLKALKDKKQFYRGFLYVGLMIKNDDPYLIEYNVRMGDPECQVIIPRLKTDLFKIINYSLKNRLKALKLSWEKTKCMTIVLCSKGYPGNYNKGKIINIKKIKDKKNLFVIHAGTKLSNNIILSNGGRVLNIVSKGKSFHKIRKKIIKLIKKINWKSGFFRKDIGWRVIPKL
ncbi:phosphoribosylamine--glycine ligase [Pelagibacteraceae bacterium]|nr:phosphoribosylamine--glycine ligase [Pelagibacteraceae bacterium]